MSHKKRKQPIMDNEHVQAIMAVIEKGQLNNMEGMIKIIEYTCEIENKLDWAKLEIAVMRMEIDALNEQFKPLREQAQGAVDTIEQNTDTLMERLTAFKDKVVEFCKELVPTLKEKGVQALSKVTAFLRPGLEGLRDGMTQGIQSNEQAIAKIRGISAEYHEAGLHIGNIGRRLAGKEAQEEAKPSGKLTKILETPFQKERACLLSARASVEKALKSLDKLERAAERKPSVSQKVQRHKEKLNQKSGAIVPIKDVRQTER